MFKISLADHPGAPVRTAAIMRRRKAIQAQHFHAAAGQMEHGRAAHAAGAQHNDIVRFHIIGSKSAGAVPAEGMETENQSAIIPNQSGAKIMLLADTQSVTLVQQIGTILQQAFGGDTPIEPLALYQIAARAAIVYLGGLIMVRIGKSRFISRTTSMDVILGFILGSFKPRNHRPRSHQRHVFVVGRNCGRALGADRHCLPIARLWQYAEGQHGTAGRQRPSVA